MISIVVRTKNEERWIVRCLDKIKAQTVKDIEVVLVDNQSSDKTVERAKDAMPGIKLVRVGEYRPGHALNEGIRASSGDYIICLSAHCLPADENWIESLLRNAADADVAGVYGRQVPMEFTSMVDKRDLLVTFGLDRRVQVKDSFFHNANSIIRRDIWNKYPFDENVTNIEDRVWGKQVIDAGYKIVYEPDAAVYHYHGIHQNNNEDRYRNVVRIMEGMKLQSPYDQAPSVTPDDLKILAIIPLRSQAASGVDSDERLILETVRVAGASKYINRVVISTDSEEIRSKAKAWGVDVPFVRPSHLSSLGVRADEVLKYSLEMIESQGYYPDLVVPLEITYPFRPEGLLDKLIEQILVQGLDTVKAGYPEYRPCWVRNEGNMERVDDFMNPRMRREPLHIGLPSLGCVTYPEFIRNGSRYGKKIGIVEIDNPIATIEIREKEDLKLLDIMKIVMQSRIGLGKGNGL